MLRLLKLLRSRIKVTFPQATVNNKTSMKAKPLLIHRRTTVNIWVILLTNLCPRSTTTKKALKYISRSGLAQSAVNSALTRFGTTCTKNKIDSRSRSNASATSAERTLQTSALELKAALLHVTKLSKSSAWSLRSCLSRPNCKTCWHNMPRVAFLSRWPHWLRMATIVVVNSSKSETFRL